MRQLQANPASRGEHDGFTVMLVWGVVPLEESTIFRSNASAFRFDDKFETSSAGL